MMDYQKMPWSIEDTIDHMNSIRCILERQVRKVNMDGKAESDAAEINYDFGRAIKALKENQEYKKLGTLEEVKEAVGKQKEKAPTYDGDGYAPDGTFVWDEWICPNCGARYEVDYDDYDYCPNCGQRIDWGVITDNYDSKRGDGDGQERAEAIYGTHERDRITEKRNRKTT